MDERRFDGIVKVLGASIARRGMLGVLAALGVTGMVGNFGAAAKGKGKRKGKSKHKSGAKRACPAKAKPACAASACQAASCDYRRGKWSCRNVCAGTSKPRCLGGQCVDACDEDLGLTECGDNCCNPLVHGECCQGKCCDLGQHCKNGQCVKSCEAWRDVTGGRLEYTISYELRGETFERPGGPTRIDQSANAVAEFECSYYAGYEEIHCENIAGTISGVHDMRWQGNSSWYEEEGSGSYELQHGITELDIRLPENDDNPDAFQFTLYNMLFLPGTSRDSYGVTRNRTFAIPDNQDVSWFDTGWEPLPPTPRVLSGAKEWSAPWISASNIAQYTWTFTPDGC